VRESLGKTYYVILRLVAKFFKRKVKKFATKLIFKTEKVKFYLLFLRIIMFLIHFLPKKIIKRKENIILFYFNFKKS